VSRLVDPLSQPPKSGFLADIHFSLAKRRKAIRHKVRDIAAEKVKERSEGVEREKLEITREIDGRGTSLRLFLWEDRWTFVDARRPTKREGWAWVFTSEGRAVVDARTIIEGLEASIDAAALQSVEAFERIWRPMLATGPRPVA
jgi:hypothetical protein